MKKTVQVNATKACLQIAGLSLFYVKTVPARAMRACSQIAERSLFYVKTVPARAMRACSQIAERSLFYVINSASESNENLFSDCRAQPVIF